MSNMWGKIIASGLTTVFVVLLVGGVTFGAATMASTGDVIGFIDWQAILSRHPRFDETVKQVQQMMSQKESEAIAAVENEPDPAKKAQIMQAMQMEVAREEQRLMEPIYKDCREVVRIVARQRNITIVLEKSSVYFGGQDITDYIVSSWPRPRR